MFFTISGIYLQSDLEQQPSSSSWVYLHDNSVRWLWWFSASHFLKYSSRKYYYYLSKNERFHFLRKDSDQKPQLNFNISLKWTYLELGNLCNDITVNIVMWQTLRPVIRHPLCTLQRSYCFWFKALKQRNLSQIVTK